MTVAKLARQWLPEEDAALLRLHATGLPPKGIAAALGRTVSSIYGRWAQIGDGTDWSEDRRACDLLLAALAKHHKPGCGELNVPNENRPMIVTPIASRSYLGSSAAMCAEWGR